MSDNLLFLGGADVDKILRHEDANILKIIAAAYIANHEGRSALPASTFLRFPNKERERIMSLPAYLGEPFNCAGIKWISSFPDNVHKNMERASAIFVLNSLETGHPIAVMESSIISAKRTAASAAMTAGLLIEDKSTVETLTVIGSGLINFESVHFLNVVFPNIKHIAIVDIDQSRAEQFKSVLQRHYPALTISCVQAMNEVISRSQIITIATTAVTPHIQALEGLQNGAVVLHTSLRDLVPEIVLKTNNIVDDISHACSANTSLHLASQIKPATEFINGTIGGILLHGKQAYIKDNRPTIVSPFGMGILDLALAQFIYQQACVNEAGISINNFIPEPWFKKSA